MAHEEKAQEDEDCIVRNEKTGEIFMRFNRPEDKQAFLKGWERRLTILDEGYRCGQCAAYPCFRGYKEEHPAGFCFQATRRCRQECRAYIEKTIDGLSAPGNGGTCRRSGREVEYEQDCHIPEMRSKVKK